MRLALRLRTDAASLRNVAFKAPCMHDGRFATLHEVVDHYDHGVKSSPHLLRPSAEPAGRPPQDESHG